MTEQSEHLVLDYLRRVGDIAHGTLRADERQDFLRRLRARIEELRASAGAGEPEQVRKILARFGDPGALVDRERQRLERERSDDSARASGQRGARTGGQGSSQREGTAAEEPEAALPLDVDSATEPLPPVGTSSQQRTGGRADGEDDGGVAGREGDGEPQGRGAETSSPGDRAGDTPAGTAGGPAHGATARGPGASYTPQALPRHGGPPVYEPSSPRQAGQELPSAASRLFEQLPLEAREALRGGVVEAAGLAFIGLGGVLAPIPLWFIGAVVVIVAAGWSLREKLTGLLPPAGLTLVGPVFIALSGGDGLGSYPEMLGSYGWPLFRVGAILGAVYLVFVLASRARRQRERQPPWLRRAR